MNKNMLGSLAACLWAFALLACSGASPPGAIGGPVQPNAPPDPSHQVCQTTDDCVVVETACCDHCNGGKAEAFNKAHAAAYQPKNCENTRCTLIGCGKAVAACTEGRCQVQIAPLVP